MLPKHGTGLRFYPVRIMSINLIRFIKNQRQRAKRVELDTLRYRGVTYTK